MGDLERPKNLDVEKTFNQFVIEQGGKLVVQLLSKIETLNADYSFETPDVIAELKCFQKDIFGSEDDIERFGLLVSKWVTKGYIKKEDEFKTLLGANELPIECKRELIERATKTIDSVIYKADKQIIETKKILGRPQAYGLLLLANNGNYFFQNAQFLSVICDLMQRKYLNSSIDGFVFFTINQTTRIPGSDLDWNIWIPSYRGDSDDMTLSNFVDTLGYQFQNVFLPKVTGVQLSERITGSIKDNSEKIREMEYIPKRIIYKNKKG